MQPPGKRGGWSAVGSVAFGVWGFLGFLGLGFRVYGLRPWVVGFRAFGGFRVFGVSGFGFSGFGVACGVGS